VYGGDDPAFLKGALDFLEAFSQITQRSFALDKLPVTGAVRPAAVFLADQAAYLSEGHPAWSRGTAMYRWNGGKQMTQLCFVTYRAPGDSWADFPRYNLQHECTHVILRRFLSWGWIPTGIDEGMSMVMQRWNVHANAAQNLDVYLREALASGLFENHGDNITPSELLKLKKDGAWYHQPRYENDSTRERFYETAGLWVWYLFTSSNGSKFYRSGVLPAIVPDGGAALDLSSRAYKICEAEFPRWVGQQFERVRTTPSR
jgi:hypothetical protein